MGFFNKPLRDKEIGKITLTPRIKMILKCIDENKRLGLGECRDCDYAAHCKRVRRRLER